MPSISVQASLRIAEVDGNVIANCYDFVVDIPTVCHGNIALAERRKIVLIHHRPIGIAVSVRDPLHFSTVRSCYDLLVAFASVVAFIDHQLVASIEVLHYT